MDIVEAVVGTAFLSPIVFSAIVACNLPPEPVIAMAAVLALPMGWLAFTFERFIFTFKGRYEHFPFLEFIRDRITLEKKDTDAYIINIENVSPADKKDKLPKKIICDDKDFELLFDPYKSLKCSKILWWKSFRRKQKHDRNILPFVENIENMMIFFDNPGLADFIRSAVAHYHMYLAAAYAFILGLLFSVGITMILNVEAFLTIPSLLQQIDVPRFTGMVICGIILLILVWITVKQSRLMLKEAIANEYLLVRLRIPEKD